VPVDVFETDLIAETTSPTDLGSLPGEVCSQYIRCGKPGCRCEMGQRHGPYYYRIWRDGDRVHKAYVKRSELKSVQQACESYRLQRQQLRDAHQERERLARHILREQRETMRLMRRLSQAV
jgi:hypothetical protein